MEQQKLITYRGGCHCKAVQFELLAPENLVVFICDCSICKMKRNDHFIVPKQHFKFISGQDNLICYTFNTHTAKHYFCKTCGIHSFYQPRSNPDGYAITIYCINSEIAKSVKFEKFQGSNWEQSFEKSDITKYSKL